MLKSRDQVHCPLCGSGTNFNNFANHLNRRHQGARYPADFALHFHFDVCGCGLGYRDVYCMNEHRCKCDKYEYPPLYLSVDHYAWNGFQAIVEADCIDWGPATHYSMNYSNLTNHWRRYRLAKIYTALTIMTASSIWNRRLRRRFEQIFLLQACMTVLSRPLLCAFLGALQRECLQPHRQAACFLTQQVIQRITPDQMPKELYDEPGKQRATIAAIVGCTI